MPTVGPKMLKRIAEILVIIALSRNPKDLNVFLSPKEAKMNFKLFFRKRFPLLKVYCKEVLRISLSKECERYVFSSAQMKMSWPEGRVFDDLRR